MRLQPQNKHNLLPPAPSAMKPVHFRVLNAICRIRDNSGSTRISDISKTLGFQLPNTTKFVNELVELNMVEKFTIASDKRIVMVRTTEAGEKYLQECVFTFRKRLQDELSKISEGDCITMIRTIREVHQLLKQVYQQ
jgi:DNA-binding MarR family transcriptional regulator